MSSKPGKSMPCQGPSPNGPAPGPLTEEDFMEGMSNLRRQIDDACEELRQKLHEICLVTKEVKEIK